MGKINPDTFKIVEFLSPEELAAVAWGLNRINEERVSAKLPEFASLEEYVMDLVEFKLIPQWTVQMDAEDFTALIKSAPAEKRAEVLEILRPKQVEVVEEVVVEETPAPVK